MAINLKSADVLPSTFPSIINTALDDAISIIPNLYDQWYASSALTSLVDAENGVWRGLTNNKRLISRLGVNARPPDLISAFAAANNKDVLRFGWDDDAATNDPATWDDNNERTQMHTDEDFFDGSSSWAVFIGLVGPDAATSNTPVWGTSLDTGGAKLDLYHSDGRLRYHQPNEATHIIQDLSDNYQDDTAHVIGIGYDATDDVVTLRTNGAQTGTATSITSAPGASRFVLGGDKSALSAVSFEGYIRSVVLFRGTSLMRGKALTGYDGDEDDALAVVEAGLLGDLGLV